MQKLKLPNANNKRAKGLRSSLLGLRAAQATVRGKVEGNVPAVVEGGEAVDAAAPPTETKRRGNNLQTSGK